MHHLVPPFILQQYQQGVYHGRFAAAALFVDVSGFTAITEALLVYKQHGAEVLAAVMRRIFDPLVRCVYEQGGFIAGFAGDAFMAFVPGEQRVSSPQAVAIGWRIQQHMTQYAHYQTPYGDFTVGVKVGIAAGRVTWGILRSADEGRATYYFKGTAVDRCLQAERLAQQGDLIISDALGHALGEMVTVQVMDQQSEGLSYFRVTQVGDLPLLTRSLASPSLPAASATSFFPESILYQAHSGEFRQVVNVFIGLAATPTESQLAAFMQTVFALQAQYGGVINRLHFDDKRCYLVLFWGTPVSYENDVARALNFVLSLQNQTAFPLHAGMTYRIAHAGFIGSPLHEEYTCYGRGVNLAARLMSKAPDGCIWIDERMAHQADPIFDVHFEGKVVLKGFAEAQAVYVLNGYKEMRGPDPFYQGELVGRREELAQLEAFVAPLSQNGCAGVLAVCGEAGMGKSRLIHAFKEADGWQTAPVKPQWFLCQTDEILRQSLNPFRYFLRGYFAYLPAHSEAENKQQFEKKLNDLIQQTADPALKVELQRTQPFLGALIDLRWPHSLYEQLPPKLRLQNTFQALKTLMWAESLQRPLILFIEDTQWLDADSRTFLAMLTQQMGAYPLALIVTSRDEAQTTALFSSFTPEIPQTRIELGALSAPEVARLAASLLRQPVAPEFVRWLGEWAEGNPFFVEQMVLYLQEQGALTQEKWGLVPHPTQTILPTDVWAILIARLDRLAQEVRQVVQTAAVLGREFALQVLVPMLPPHTAVISKVKTAEAAHIWIALSQIHYLFKHTLLREAAYEMQLQAQRQHLHRVAAAVIEQVYQDDLAPRYADLAYHYGRAQNQPQEKRYAELAGKQAAEQFANEEAVTYLNRALVLTPVEDAVQRYSLLLVRENVYHVQGAREAQAEDLAALRQLAAVLMDRQRQAEVALRQARYAEVTSDFATASAAAQEAIALAHEMSDSQSEAKGYLYWGRASWRQGDEKAARTQLAKSLALIPDGQSPKIEAEALRTMGALAAEQGNYDQARLYYEQALPICRAPEVNDKEGESATLNNLGVIFGRLGDYLSAKVYYQEALRLRQEMGNRRGEGQTLNNLGVVSGYLGDFAEAKTYYEGSLQIRRDIGDRRGEGMALGNIGVIYAYQGDYEQARHYCTRSLDISRQIGDRWGEGWTLTYLGLIYHHLGAYQEAWQHGQQALDITREIGDQSTEGETLIVMAHVLTDSGRLVEAEALYQYAWQLRLGLHEYNQAIEPLAGLARISLLQERVSEAHTYVEMIWDHLQAHTLAGVLETFYVYLICYQVLLSRQDERAELILQQGYELLQAQAAKISDGQMRDSFLHNVATHRAIIDAFMAGRGSDHHL